MKLTPLDIHQKEFRRSLRGYNEEDVDAFLDEVAAEFERIFQENIDLREELERVEKRLKQFENFEKTVHDTMLAAQKSAEELEQNARRSAELIVRDAELKSKEIIQAALARKQEIESEIGELRELVENFREKMKSILENYLDLLEKVDRESKKIFSAVEERKELAEESLQEVGGKQEKEEFSAEVQAGEEKEEKKKREVSLEEDLESIPEASVEEG